MKALNYWKRVVLTGILTLVLTGTVGCGGAGGNDSTEVHIGYFNNITHAQALLMKEEKTLENRLGNETQVSWTAFNAGPAEVEALFAGDIDIGYIGPVPAVSANVKSNGDVVILSGATKGGAVLVGRKGAGIKSVADLSGKTVAIPQIGNTQHLCLLSLLKENGLKPVSEGGDVNVSAVQNADTANMMERGDIDAALVPEPWGATLLKEDAELALDYTDVYMNGDYDVAVVVVRKEFMEKHPDIVDKFLDEHEAATARIQSEPENAIQKINSELKNATGKALDETIIQEAFQRIGINTELNRESIMDFAAISKEAGFIGEMPEESGLFAQ